MKRRTLVLTAAVVVLLAAIVVGVALRDKFLPERSTQLNEEASASAIVLKEGTFSGRAGHSASGTVKLVRDGADHYLRFENFQMTSGPMVYLYLAPSPEPDSKSEIDDATKIYIDGGADGGELTKRGSFNQKLPAGLDIDSFQGVGAWCDEFSVPFGVATLQPPA